VKIEFTGWAQSGHSLHVESNLPVLESKIPFGKPQNDPANPPLQAFPHAAQLVNNS
jgi:hypothetical protein